MFPILVIPPPAFVPGFIFGAIFLGHYIITGVFTGFLFAGFTSAFLYGLTVIFLILGILADMLDRIRLNQERILYHLKKSKKSKKSKQS